MARRKDPDKLLNNREVIYLNDDLKEFTSIYCHERKIPLTELVRMSLRFFRRHIQIELSKEKQRIDSAKVDTNSAHPGGLYTAEQVAQLINAIKVEK